MLGRHRMSNTEPFFAMLDISLQHVSHHAERANALAYALYGLIEGDGPEDAAALLEKYGYTDPETGEWIYGDDE